MVLHTCDRMAAGGIHDQLGGGFARYSVDAEWLVPHFEKMLYDNAQLAQLYLDAFLVSGEARYAEVARDILDYVLRDMTHPGRRLLFRRGCRQRRTRGQVLLLDARRAGEAAHARGIQSGGPLLRHHGAGQLRGPQPSPAAAEPERAEHRRPSAHRAGEALAGVGQEEDAGRARPARAPAMRRQGAGVLERPDARRDGAGRRGVGRRGVSRRRGEEPRLPQGQALGRQNHDPLAPLARRRARQRAVARRLRLPAGGGD